MANTWLNRLEYPFESNYFDTNGYKLHYIDEGKGETLLFVHGTPSWSFDFRNIIKRLKSNYRCVAIDHIGFGLSDKPHDYDYSTLRHSKTLENFILHHQLDGITLVVHDFGGPIALNFAIRYPEKIKRLVVLNSWLWSSQSDPDFIKLKKILRSPLLPFLYRYLNFSPKYILPKSFGDSKLPVHLLNQYTSPFANKSQRNGALGFVYSLLYDQEWFETLWHNKQAIAHLPILFLWGMKDPVINPHYLDKFISGFVNPKVVRLDTCGHFPQEEQADVCAQSILDFLFSNEGQ